jgi:hypothetical protein
MTPTRSEAGVHLIVAHIVKGLGLPKAVKDFFLKARVRLCEAPDEAQLEVTKLFQNNISSTITKKDN